ncbi:glycosyltransferase [Williamsia phyllosphaerae]|uniref:Glycosyltransferase subfamily 4-like N-terminal domain-containing protein n=1 Tax=Williamsia phyllosphaerae TaxID=885042 RepID=A0ABQ1UJH9_9NOCA|nr:glycosyltransferase [Williamsia phyllosphaerae]GGF20220.1 hypothetical protein GCM10007298_15240 [Williamsia phyllosphaerae]
MITVASVPSAHVYVDHLAPTTTPADQVKRVVRLPDPTPANATMDGQWWPPRLLENDWLLAHINGFDVLHVHFGFDTFAPEDLAAVVRTLNAFDKPLVLTVHDLHNPHFPDNRTHLAQLDVLVPAAHTVITLTRGAADAIAARWGVRAQVIGHPHVVPLTQIGRPRPHSDGYVVGVHAKNLRANLDPLTLMDTLVEAVRAIPDASLRLDIDNDVFDQFSHWYSPTIGAKLCDYATYDEVDIRVHPRFDDAQLWTYMSSIDVSVLPYRYGTHSGWLEACHDLGTAVIAPTCGFYDQQQPCATFDFGSDTFDPSSLIDAVVRTHATSTVPASREQRCADRDAIAAAHAEVYERALGDAR